MEFHIAIWTCNTCSLGTNYNFAYITSDHICLNVRVGHDRCAIDINSCRCKTPLRNMIYYCNDNMQWHRAKSTMHPCIIPLRGYSVYNKAVRDYLCTLFGLVTKLIDFSFYDYKKNKINYWDTYASKVLCLTFKREV